MRSEESPAHFQPDAVRTALGRSPARVLVIGPAFPGLEAVWRTAGVDLRRIPTARLASSPGPWDVIVLAGSLERERWDRWLVQRAHHALAPGGLLVLSVPNLMNIASVNGAAYFASRALRQLRRRLSPQAVIPQADRSSFRARRYRRAALAAMIAGVGFEILPQATAALSGTIGEMTTRAISLTARRLPSLWGAGRPFPERERLIADYVSRHAQEIARRDAWQGSRAAVRPERVDIGDWARRGAIVFSPHPDDEVIGCGGTLLDIARGSGAVTIVQVTDGSDSAAFIDEPEEVRRQVRLDEADSVARALGARELVCLRADNRALRATPELRARFRECLERSRAGVVFAPTFSDFHPDHQTVLEILVDTMREWEGDRPLVALYEVWGLVAATHVHPVGESIDDIESLLLRYETALKIDDYVHLVAERLLYHSYVELGEPGYVEAFEVLPGDRFVEIGVSRRARAGSPA